VLASGSQQRQQSPPLPQSSRWRAVFLADPDAVRPALPNLLRRRRLAAAGNLLPGPSAANTYHDFAFALPGGAKESYFELKFPLIRRASGRSRTALGDGMMPVSPSPPSPFRMLLLRGSERCWITAQPARRGGRRQRQDRPHGRPCGSHAGTIAFGLATLSP